MKKKGNWTFFGSIVMMTAIYLLIEYRLIFSLVFPEAPTSRNEFISSTLGFWHSTRLACKNYFLGHTHVMTIHTLVIVPLSFMVLWAIRGKVNGSLEKRYRSLFILNIVLSVWYAFWFYQGWGPLKEKFPLLNTFNFARFHFLRPLIIYLMFAVGGYILWRKGAGWQKFVKICLISQVIILLGFNEEIRYRVAGEPSFKQFYATEEFAEINQYIGEPKGSYRVASIGLHPAIAQYNGFYTLDTYNNFYPLEYKHQFRKIIATELDKNSNLKKYFDTWGGRCYIFVAELGKNYDFRKDSDKKIRHLQLNTKVFKNMGGKYIFSSVPIMNAKSNGLIFKKAFEQKDSAWRIYLYEVK
ncbi:hypothetical protein HNR53_003847 [Bacillus benzoevorans]|uniref:Uncharacterized protein n=1 Tax=Bacillus benzoevorans TaxID=1456 RepID=A0A7X0HUP1_9BACI|nr:hypothetical protein [Bacillus benzoevorans]